jgi:hypothetical protein
MVDQRPGARARLEHLLRAGELDFKTLLRNPPPSQQDADIVRKATTEVGLDWIGLVDLTLAYSQGIMLPGPLSPPGSDVTTTLSPSLVEEALMLSELFKVSLERDVP